MADCEDLLARARNNPKGLRFDQICTLAECYGWEFARTRGSHHIYKRAGTIQPMNFQNDKGKAVAYQVKQLLAAIDSISND